MCLCLQQPAGGAGCVGGPGSLHLPSHQPEVRLPRGRGPLASAREQHQQVRDGSSNPSLGLCELNYNVTCCMFSLNRKFLLTKPMHMAAEDSGVCQLHSISEDSVSSGHGVSSGTYITIRTPRSSKQRLTGLLCFILLLCSTY